MTVWNRLPLRVRLVLVATGLVAIALVATGIAARTALSGYLVGRTDTQLAASAQAFSDRILHGQTALGGPGPDDRDGVIRTSEYYLQISQADGSILPANTAQSPQTHGRPDLPKLDHATVQKHDGKPFTVKAASGGSKWRVIAQPLPSGQSLVVALSLADVDRTIDRLDLVELVVGLIVLTLMVGLGFLAVTRSLRPLREVEETAGAIAGGDLSRRVPETDPRTEVGRLAVAFNAMVSRIQTAFEDRSRSEAAARTSEERMRRFVADASHELRTPLTSIRGFAELYRQGAVTEPDQLRRVMRRVEEEATRMGLLVEDLLLLARLDQERPLERRPVDLLSLAADSVHDAHAVEPDRDITLHADAQNAGVPVVVGDEARLRQVVSNLVTNALTHTPHTAPIEVRVKTEQVDGVGWAVLTVADQGPGLADDEAARVFERFYRADTSRTRASGGNGLGLSIVAALVAAHGGHVDVESETGHGATFRVRLPLSSAGEPEARDSDIDTTLDDDEPVTGAAQADVDA